MSGELAAAAWQCDLPAIDKLILIKLCLIANDDGTKVFPRVPHFAGDVGCSDRKIQLAFRQFEDRGLLVLVGRGGGRQPSEYRIDIGVLASMTRPAQQGRIRFTPAVNQLQGRGEPRSPQRCTGFAPLNIEYNTNKEIGGAADRADDLWGEGRLKEKWDSIFPNLASDEAAFKTELERAVTWHRGKGIPIGDLKAMFSSWLDNPKTHAHVLKAPKHLKETKRRTPAEAIRPTRGPNISAEDTELVAQAIREFEGQRPGVWQNWFRHFTLVSLEGNVLTMDGGSEWRAKHFQDTVAGSFETCLAKAGRRRLEVQMCSLKDQRAAVS